MHQTVVTCISKSGSRSSLADATDATLALETESSDDEDDAGAGAWERERRRPPLRPRPLPSRLPGTWGMEIINGSFKDLLMSTLTLQAILEGLVDSECSL